MTYVAILKYSLYLGRFVGGLINVCIVEKYHFEHYKLTMN